MRRLRTAQCTACAVALGASLLRFAAPAPARALPITITYLDAAGEGFDDPALGMPRRAAFERAVMLWAQTLGGSVPIVVEAAMDPLGGSSDSALLASTRALTVHRDFPDAPWADTFYGAALASQLSGADVNGAELAEIRATFNSDLDGAVALGSVGWYYGLDGQPGPDIDLVTIALHELGHGLGFFSHTDAPSGDFVFGVPAVFDTYVLRPGVGLLPSLSPAQRRVAVTSGSLVWDGPYVLARSSAPPPLFAPNPFQDGASLSHWDTSLADELLVPFYTGPVHDPGLLLPALRDMGWTLANETPSPPAPTRTPTPTAAPIPTEPGAVAKRRRIYVSNFASDTVSVIDGTSLQVTATVPVGRGPIGLAASRDGRRVAVASFRGGSVTLLRTSSNTVERTITLGRSCREVAILPDNRTAYVTNTQEDSVSVVDLDAGRLATTIPVGRQPVGIAALPGGQSVLVAEFGANAVEAIDTSLEAVTAVTPLGVNFTRGALAIAVSADGRRAAVSGVRIVWVPSLDPRTLALGRRVFLGSEYARLDGVWMSPDGSRALVIGTAPGATTGSLLRVALDTEQVLPSTRIGREPAAIAGSADGEVVYIANAGSNTVSVVRAPIGSLRNTVQVGEVPMGVAVAEVPQCPGDCDGNGAVIVTELMTAVRIALGVATSTACPAADPSQNGTVTIDEILAAVDAVLGACTE